MIELPARGSEIEGGEALATTPDALHWRGRIQGMTSFSYYPLLPRSAGKIFTTPWEYSGRNIRKLGQTLIRISRHYISNIFCLILAGDLAMFFASVALTYLWMDWVGAGALWSKITVLAAMTLLLLYLADLYHFQLQFDKGELVLRVGLATVVASGLTAAIGYAIPSLRFSCRPFSASPSHRL